jgi:glucose 1-dehydrogenase
MRALALDYRNRKLVERSVPDPLISSPVEVLTRVQEVGICGTDRDLAAFRFGRPPAGEDYLVLGHEALAQVIATGEGVTSLRAGDWVVPVVRRSCSPPCRSCASGRRDLCLTGGYTERGISGAHGYFSEKAVDVEEDLVAVPEGCRTVAVLIEPLSVVEKAVALALRLHQGAPETALVVGAGAVGLLAAMVLQRRGLRAGLLSLEPARSSRARLVSDAGVEYMTTAEEKYDIVIEAAGSEEAAMTGLAALGPLGVMILLGAKTSAGNMPLLDMIVNNQMIAGSVNASPAAFAAAADDLPYFPRHVLESMIRREPFEGWQRSLRSDSDVPKVVHVIG